MWRAVVDEKNSPKKCLVIASSCLVIALLGIAIYVSGLLRPGHEPARLGKSVAATREVCTTKECEETSAYIVDKINFSADPCEDMHLFSCGNYNAKKSSQAGRYFPRDADSRFKEDAFKIMASKQNTKLLG
ncbi:unnamed protein product, partial [Lymnaea stagnalis]